MPALSAAVTPILPASTRFIYALAAYRVVPSTPRLVPSVAAPVAVVFAPAADAAVVAVIPVRRVRAAAVPAAALLLLPLASAPLICTSACGSDSAATAVHGVQRTPAVNVRAVPGSASVAAMAAVNSALRAGVEARARRTSPPPAAAVAVAAAAAVRPPPVTPAVGAKAARPKPMRALRPRLRRQRWGAVVASIEAHRLEALVGSKVRERVAAPRRRVVHAVAALASRACPCAGKRVARLRLIPSQPQLLERALKPQLRVGRHLQPLG
mmetsp:Transcript_30993/g.92201  ORF Transcript_30993/g.92201 Transcript_30993/m.92201 type:complete len:268 (+) Transcript_30993:180-983(+)